MNIVRVHKERTSRSAEPIIEGSQGCCGLDILQNIYDTKPEKVIAYVYRKYCGGDSWHTDRGRPVPFIVFTHSSFQENCRHGFENTVRHDGVCELAEYIEKNNLGQFSSFTGYNPNSGNNLTAYLWHIDAKGLEKWHRKNDNSRRRSQPARTER